MDRGSWPGWWMPCENPDLFAGVGGLCGALKDVLECLPLPTPRCLRVPMRNSVISDLLDAHIGIGRAEQHAGVEDWLT